MKLSSSLQLLCLTVGLAVAFDASAAPAAPAASAPAAKPALTGKHDSDAPINIAADKFIADENAKTGTWSGNVVIIQGDMRMRANTVRMNVVGSDNKPDKIFAQGGVVVDSPSSGTVTGDNGVYDVVQRSINLTGHVVLTKQKNSMRGNQMTVNLVTGIATLGGGAAAPGTTTPTGRVQGIFTPANKGSGGN
jgi:lipopolysaccharide export system protein LptA